MKVNSEKKKVLKIYFCFYDAEGKYYRYFRYYSTRVKATSTVQGTFIATELLSKFHTFCYVYGLLVGVGGGAFQSAYPGGFDCMVVTLLVAARASIKINACIPRGTG